MCNISAGLAPATALLGTSASAQISDDVLKIGVLADMTGPASTPTGRGSLTAAQLAVDDFGADAFGPPDPACKLIAK
ncbi:MAG: hypothetical protein A4S14_15140 [Proteobacteria bacterium SG_bin9]|nr:MAG: hypothetical protein A4S14_15140 [Proteobacteria bacterium SG_bin9]